MTGPADAEAPPTRPTRLGVLYPASGAEDEYRSIARVLGGVDVRITHTESDNRHDLEALRQTARVERLLTGARTLVPWKPDVVTWACTSGSFIVGRAGALAQVQALRETLGVPAGSTSLAFVEAAAGLGARRVAVLAPYGRAAAESFREFLDSWRIEVVAIECLDLPSGYDSARLSAAEMQSAARRASHPRAQALLIPDTALHSSGVVRPLERKLDIPVLAANVVTVWQALRLIGHTASQPTLGRLFSPASAVCSTVPRPLEGASSSREAGRSRPPASTHPR